MQLLTKVNALGVSMASQDGLVLVGNVRTGSDNVLWMQKELAELNVTGLKTKIVGPSPESDDRTARWITLQLRGTAQAFRDALERWRQ